MEEERILFDYLYVLVKWRRLILGSVLGIAALTAAISLVLPQTWTATTTLLPPEEDADQLGVSMLMAEGMGGGLGALAGKAAVPSERLLTLLDSRRVLGPIVDRFDLVARYDAPHRDQAIEVLGHNIDKQKTRDGTLVVKVTAGSPELAAGMANALAGELEAANRENKRQQARSLRAFLEERMRQGREEFAAGAVALQQFQDASGLVDVQGQTQAVVEVIESMVQKLATQEVSLEVRRRQLSADHEERRWLEMEVEELHRRLQTMIGKHGASSGSVSDPTLQALGPSLKALPELGREYTRLTLELKLKEEILRFLGTKLEEARYKEALDTPTIQVLDPATPPAVRTSPRRALMVLVAALLSLCTSTSLAFAGESWGRLERQHSDKLEAIRRLLAPPS
jgi:uncharacterized protein involved in exopolysaccharide biosynthesis